MAALFSQIIIKSPPLNHLNLQSFSRDSDYVENPCMIILEALYTSQITTILHLDLNYNESWFKSPITWEVRENLVELLALVIGR